MRKSRYISHGTWNEINADLRKAILAVLPFNRTDIVGKGKFISWLEDELRKRGEYGLADMLVTKEDGQE